MCSLKIVIEFLDILQIECYWCLHFLLKFSIIWLTDNNIFCIIISHGKSIILFERWFQVWSQHRESMTHLLLPIIVGHWNFVLWCDSYSIYLTLWPTGIFLNDEFIRILPVFHGVFPIKSYLLTQVEETEKKNTENTSFACKDIDSKFKLLIITSFTHVHES